MANFVKLHVVDYNQLISSNHPIKTVVINMDYVSEMLQSDKDDAQTLLYTETDSASGFCYVTETIDEILEMCKK